jgi:serine protease
MQKARIVVALTLLSAISAEFSLKADGRQHVIMAKQSVGAERYKPGQVIVKFREPSDRVTEARVIREGGGIAARRSAFGARYNVVLEEGLSVSEAVTQFTSKPEVEYATPNVILRAMSTPNDPLFSRQWNFELIHFERTLDIQPGDPSVGVAVIDTGIAFEDNPPIFAKAPDWGTITFLQGFNVFTGDSHADDDNGHGTNVASIIAEETNNNIGYAGISSCALMSVKVLDSSGNGTGFGVAEGIDYVTNFRLNGSNPVRVINMSLGTAGGGGDDPTIDAALDRAFAAGIVLVAAAGNESLNAVDFPAAHPNVIAVGAATGAKTLASYSNSGSALSVVAPGGSGIQGAPDGGVFTQNYAFDVLPPGLFNQFSFDFGFAGTSQATPHVSAVAALLFVQGITDPSAIRAAIESTAEHLGAAGVRNDTFGHGLVRPDLALNGLGLNQ